MNLKQVIVNNSGMSQDMSISKQDDKFAFENKNIRIQATDDGTLLSITNLRNPKAKNTVNIQCNKVLGSCVTPDYLVIFCIYKDSNLLSNTYDCIYRIDLKLVDSDVENSWKVLYKSLRGVKKINGSLNFSDTSYFDTLYHEEGENIKKVYWVDGVNRPRVINLITPTEIETGGAEYAPYDMNVFEFYPDIYRQSFDLIHHTKITQVPEITATKNRSIVSELPAGVIQYFMSYYTINGAETLIAASSDTYTIDFSNRGAKADETGMCAFDVEIPAKNVNTKFDYIRVYSALRTVENGQLTVKIVGDIRINKNADDNNVYKITDNGINQEQLQDGYIDFIGGTPFIAKTLTEKEDTAFFGNIKTENVLIPDTLKNIITDSCFDVDGRSSKVITFSLTKEIPLNQNQFGIKYPYSLQLDKGSKSYKTFKSGECYRFGIQFQTMQGQWSDVAWIGDVECILRPSFDEEHQAFKVNDVNFTMPEEVKEAAESNGYIAYRILYADPENSNGRRIKAQGVLCPTMFTPGQRAMNAPYSLPSWVMRPRKSYIAYHHFEPVFSSLVNGGEIAGCPYYNKYDGKYPQPYIKGSDIEEGDFNYIVTYLTISGSGLMAVRSVKIKAPENSINSNFYYNELELPKDKYEILCDYIVNYGDFSKALKAETVGNEAPYGFTYFDTSNEVYHYGYPNSNNNIKVIGLEEAYENNGLDDGWLPDVAALNEQRSTLWWSGESLWETYAKSVGLFTFRRAIAHPTNIKNSIKNNSLLRQNFVPVYANSARHVIVETRGSIPASHDFDYLNKGDLDRFENLIFSGGETGALVSDLFGSVYYYVTPTIPEIFRPHCTVESFAGSSDYVADGTYVSKGAWNFIEAFVQVIPLAYVQSRKDIIRKTKHDYFVDESILTLHSPDLESYKFTREETKFRIIGTAELDYSSSLFEATLNRPALEITGGIDSQTLKDRNTQSYNPLYSEYVYNDAIWETVGSDEKLAAVTMGRYNTYLFGTNNYLGITKEDEMSQIVPSFKGELPGKIKIQQIYNNNFSKTVKYLNLDKYKYDAVNYGDVYCKFVDTEDETCVFKINTGSGFYYNKFDDIIINDSSNPVPHIYVTESSALFGRTGNIFNKESIGETHIKFSQTSHLLLNLQSTDALVKYILPHFVTSIPSQHSDDNIDDSIDDSIDYSTDDSILPHFANAYGSAYFRNDDYFIDVVDGKDNIFEGGGGKVLTKAREEWERNRLASIIKKPVLPIWDEPEYIGEDRKFPVKYNSPEIKYLFKSPEPDKPYLFVGEVYDDIPNESLYGGVDITALRKLSWIPSSKVMPISTEPITDMEGDTYYQRWDCLKTFPTTEEDVNQIVDITSFMVETHKNLDARTDIYRTFYNIMSRPNNFNLFNDIYNQKNNIFEYTTRWNELSTESVPNQIVWSMAKNYFGDIDMWTSVNTSSSTRVTYPVTKLLNYNNSVVALTEHSLETVNFNAKQLVPATDNSFIELQNSNKVDGTTKLQAPYGSHNMSTLITEKGLYFIEDNEKSLIRLGGEAGITKIGTTSMIDWLKNHIVQGTYVAGDSKKPFRLEYDSVHKDIYIINDEYCLVYNETLDAFISFITYSGEYWLYNYNGKLLVYRLDSKNKHLHIHEMYAGDAYNGDFQEYNYSNDKWLDPVGMEYSVWYRINPGPYSDKVFTNGTLMADIGVTGTNTQYPNSTKTNDRPFNTLRVWTEYQDTTEVPLEHILDKPSLLKQKFRFWRFTIPRDANSTFKRDRIRNPWIHLQLKGNSTKKMEFHNLTIQYME